MMEPGGWGGTGHTERPVTSCCPPHPPALPRMLKVTVCVFSREQDSSGSELLLGDSEPSASVDKVLDFVLMSPSS